MSKPKTKKYARRSKPENRIEEVKQLKNGDWRVNFRIGNKRDHIDFRYKHEAKKFEEDFIPKIKGKCKLVTGKKENRSTEIELARCFYESQKDLFNRKKIKGRTYRSRVDQFIYGVPEDIQTLLLSEITEKEIEIIRNFCSIRKDGKESNGTKFKNVKECFLSVYKYASKKGYVNFGVDLDDVSAPVNRVKNRDTYNKKDFLKFIEFFENPSNNIRDRYNCALLILNMQLGLRIGEFLALEFSDFNEDEGTVHVYKTVTTDEGNKPIISPETKTGRDRIITVPSFGWEVLDFIKKALSKYRTAFILHSPKRYSKQKPWGVRANYRVGYGPKNTSWKCRDICVSTKEEAEKILIDILNFNGPHEDQFPDLEIKWVAQPLKEFTFHKSPQGFVNVSWRNGLLKKMGMRYLNSHNACRKSMTTMLVVESDDDFFTSATEAQQRLGHKDLSTTIDSYLMGLGMKKKTLDKIFSKIDPKRKLTDLSKEELIAIIEQSMK